MAPRTPLEAEIAEIWAEVLGIAQVGVDDDFFGAGGDSIMAAALVARARDRLQADVSLGAFVQEPTIAAFARTVGPTLAQPAATGAALPAGGSPASPQPAAPVATTARCSYAQERFWFIDQASESNAVSNVSWALRLRGGLNVPVLGQSLALLAERHESLRTRFELQEGHPVGVVDLPAELPLEFVGVADDAAARRLAARQARVPFDLSRGPLLRTHVLRLSGEDHVLHFVAHHIVCDDWSKGVIMAELGALYEALLDGEAPAVPAPATQYPSYAQGQRERLDEDVLRRELEHWQKELADAPPTLELATDRPRPPAPSMLGARLRTTIPAELTTSMRTIGRAEGTTFFMTMLAAFQALLLRYTGQEDLVIGTAVDNRGRVELESSIGLFTNVLALRADLSGSPTFRELLSRVRARTLVAIAHQDLPFDRLAASAPDRDASRHPIFQAFYEFVVPAPMQLPLPGVSVEPFEVPKHSAEFDLGLFLDEQWGGLDAVWEYSTDLFDTGTIERMARHFIALLSEITADPDRPVAELALLNDAERDALREWNATAASVPEVGLHELFEGWARRSPDAPAVTAAEAELSYAELNARANRIAHLLGDLDVSRGDSVGLCLERSADLVAALLGILKAGAAYVPLNPGHPPRRLVAQLSSAGAEVLVGEGELAGFDGSVVQLDDERLARMPSDDPVLASDPAGVAYVLFTSGSTGVPKGVAVTHRNIVNYTAHMIGALEDPGAGRLHFASVSSVSTDLGNTAIFPALASGGCLHLLSNEVATDASQFAAYVSERPIDVLKITPSHLSSLLDAATGTSILPRRWLIIGGETLTWELADRVTLLGGPRVLNHYGPTEATVGCCTFEVRAAEPRPPSATVPIGRPIANTRAYVLDSLGAPAPVGVPGQLHIGGAGVAIGYVNQPEQTAKVFLDDPFSSDDQARLYRTGDLARYLPDGSLEFLGRADEQVKIRGYRVEPAEVQAVLARRGGLRQVAVVTSGEGEAKRLVAYVVGGAAEITPGALRAELEHELPAYMVPSSIVVLDALPLTPNGKLDRAALPPVQAPAFAPDESEAEAEAEQLSDTQAQLVGIWSDLLEHKVGPDDNFFEVGGHSLLAIRLVARLRTELNVKLSLKALIDSPTIRQLAAKVEDVRGSTAQEAEHGSTEPSPAAEAEVPAISRVPRDQQLHCSFAQEQLWLVDQLTPGSAAYNFSWPMRLRGSLDVGALARAVSALEFRHQVLRTRFTSRDGEPVPIIDGPGALKLSVIDLSTDRDPEHEAQRLMDEQTQTPFDLSTGSLLRIQLLRLGDEDHILQIVVHHIVFDGVSKVVLYAELSRLYEDFAAGRDHVLAEPAIQHVDYAEWQRSWLVGDRLDGELDYWRTRLAGIPSALELPTDRPRPPVASLRGGRLRTPLPSELRAGLDRVARTAGATFFSAVLAAFNVLLCRYTGQEDVIVGAPVDTRDRPELAEVIGPFINTIVLRNDLSGSPSFVELLGRVHARTLDAIEHKELPFERLVSALAPDRDLSRHPIFQVLLALNPPETGLFLPGIAVQDIDPSWAAARVDLFLVLDDLPQGLEAIWEYSTDLFDAATIERMAGHFVRLLEEVVADPNRPIDQLSLLSDVERSRVLDDWNQTEAQIPDRRLEDLIGEQVARAPDHVAVQFDGVTLTYSELDARANQLAHRLRKLGVGDEDLVGVCLRRSERLLVALLGTMKAGAAYVPIDPTYPLERQRFMIADAHVRVLITESETPGELLAGPTQILLLDRDRAELEVEPIDPPEPVADAAGLAYVIYTSGSTGQPKGVEIQHRALVNFLETMRKEPGLGTSDVLVAVTTLSFDIAGLELYLPLTAGARVVLASTETAADPPALERLLERSKATIMQATPTTWRMLLDNGWTGQPGFRALCGGEALAPGLADELVDRGFELWNMYGPTETTIWSACSRIPARGQPLTIGRPIANTTLYILDGRAAPTPIGVPGELHIGGAGLARGYHNRPELTAERFVIDPFDGRPGARLYKTGDLARYRSDGTIDFLGRLDQQIKLRGFRIELGEIETRLAAHPSVAAAAAAVQTQASGDPALVAYVVAAGEPVDVGELSRMLTASLPGYMVPASIVTLDALPLTPNAKVDRAALPAPDASGAPVTSHYVAPRTDTEKIIAEVWAELLGVQRVGVEDNFFALGGQSLLAARLMRRLDSRLHVELPLRSLFETPTVAGLAARIEGLATTNRQEEPPPLLAMARVRRPSFAQERFWFIDQVAGASGAYNISWPVRLRGPLDVPALERGLDEIIRRHEVLRTRFTVEDGRPVALIDSPSSVKLEFTDLRPNPERELEARRIVDAQTEAPFDIAEGPLLRAALVRLDEHDHIFQIVVHHIVADGGSKAVFFDELGGLYGAFADNRPSPLPEVPVQYGDFAEWQSSWLKGARLEQELAHWRAELEGAPLVLELPTDRPRPAVASLRGAWRRTTIPPGLTDAVQELAGREGSTLFMVMLAAFELLLHRYCGQPDLVVGTPVDTRSRAELEQLIGPFVNSIVVRGEFSGSSSFRELLVHVRHRTLDAIEHQELPFERLVEQLAPERDLRRHPIFQAQLALNPPEKGIRLPGIDTEELETAKTTSRVDLTLLLQPQPDGWQAVWEYSTDLFDSETIDGMAGHFLHLLESIVADPGRRIDDLELIDADERDELLGTFGAHDAEFEVGCLHERFEAQAAAAPDAIAVTDGHQTLSYQELNQRANRLAHRLRAVGVGPDTLVALCLQRSLDLVVAVVATLKAGGAYVPLDPDYPADRLALILEDCQAPVLITQDSVRDRLPEHEATTIYIDRDESPLAGETAQNPAPLATPDNLAYVIYTSGSTGQPKGVEIEHRNVFRLFSATEPWFGFGEADTWTLLHSYAFDFSVWEMWGALLHGGKLVVVQSWTARTPEVLAELLVRERVTVLNATPSLFLTAMDDLLARADELALRLVVFGGEALEPKLLRPWFERFGDERPQLVNMYGITETTVHVTYRPLSAPDADAEGSPIGVPIPDLQLYLLDGRLSPVPVGVAGELFVGGAGLARGYLNRPELTAQRFVENPFAAGRLYRTGDGGRWVRGKGLVYEGRLDDQVKVRGFRIELGEIRSVLSDHADVAECAVIAAPATGGARLTAYVVPASAADQPQLGSDLRAWLRGKLPDYMVPSSVVPLDALPLTANGKLDRRALPAPEDDQRAGETAWPETPTELAIAELWQELLGTAKFGVDEDFFDLGGHSLLAAQLAARIRARFQVPFSVRAVFEAPTVAGLARRLASVQPDGSDGSGASPIPRRRLGERASLSYSQQQLWLIDQWDSGAPTYGVALPFRIRGALDLDALGAALRTLLDRHEALRTVIEVHDDEPVPVVLDDPPFELTVIDLGDASAEEREAQAQRIIAELARRPFDFSRDPLLRATAVVLGRGDRILLLETHHIAFDGWSERLLLDELAACYEGRWLPELPLQFADFALWQRDRLAGDELAQELAFWRRHLAGAPTSIELPADHARPEGLRFQGARHDVALGRAAAESLAALCRHERVTAYMLVLATLGTVLYRVTGQDDILVGSPAANRGRVELESLIGFVSNTLVFRVRLGGNPTFRELLGQVREMALDAYAHQSVPFEKVVEALRPEREPGVNPLFQVNLRVRGSKRPKLRLPGLQVEPLRVDSGFARFDLALDLDVLEDAVGGYFRYNRDIFEPATITRLADEFIQILRAALADPDRRLLSFSLIGDWSGSGRPAGPGLRNFRGRRPDEARPPHS